MLYLTDDSIEFGHWDTDAVEIGGQCWYDEFGNRLVRDDEQEWAPLFWMPLPQPPAKGGDDAALP